MKNDDVKPYRTSGANTAKVRIVIETQTTIGTGLDESDPVRHLYQYFDLDGTLLAKQDTSLEPPEQWRTAL